MMKRGFTLLEVLVALFIMTLFIALVQGVYTGTTRSRERAVKRTVEAHTASAVLQRIADELAMSFQLPGRMDQTYFLLTTDSENTSTLEFTSRTPAIPSIRTGGDTRIRYEIERSTRGGDGDMALMRYELADLFGRMDLDSTAYEMLTNVTTFEVECFNGEEWVTAWDESSSSEPLMPLAVKIRLGWGDDEDNEELMETSTPIYSAAGRNARQ
ncbi:MAG: hypothetical protein C0608_07145 [Deltaproteobacteria bacterium]|nr:MAG: hypothetical protein C0608_07145 [Deltaproteobacteria bacterium]